METSHASYHFHDPTSLNSDMKNTSTSAFVTTKPLQEKIPKVVQTVKPRSTKKSSRSKLRHSTGHEAYHSLFTSSAPSRPK